MGKKKTNNEVRKAKDEKKTKLVKSGKAASIADQILDIVKNAD